MSFSRRRFLWATGAGVLLAPATAQAFAVIDCAPASEEPACRTLSEHAVQQQRLDLALQEQGLSEEQRKTVLAAATCSFCGQLLSANHLPPRQPASEQGRF